ncbi:type VI secretion system protein IglI family protein [Sorangium sp. So ce176]|uniref:type VI secretion system protein IglI family protein n=1 Tax=Sorangium sp. So ce176 TaxID=3133286 RepID=UPI003F5EAE87
MIDIALASRALDGPGQDMAESAVDALVRLVQTGEHLDAARQAAKALAAGGTDIRAIAALLLGAFGERGPAALPGMLDVLTGATGRRWEAIRPAARRDRAVDSALCLLFRSVKASIDFHESARDATWRAWVERVERDLARACLDAAAAFEAAAAERIASPRCVVELAGLKARIELFLQKMPRREPPPEPVAAPEEKAEAAADDADDAEAAADAAPAAAGIQEGEPAPPAPGTRVIQVSPALEQFIRKLEAFAGLVEQGEMGKAAIVARDIKAAVDSFDPRVYLPALLAPHFRLLSAHIDAIAPHWAAADSPAWEALEQLYQVDLDAFLEP